MSFAVLDNRSQPREPQRAALPFEVVRLSPVETYIRDQLSIQFVSGVLYSTEFPNGHAHSLDYWQTNLRFGRALNQPKPEPSFFRGNFEALLEITGSTSIEDRETIWRGRRPCFATISSPCPRG